jgi:serine/threonine protein phosphatase PrpC
MKFAGNSITGNIKKQNEDHILIKEIDNDIMLLAVADGLGGQPSGHVASEVAIEAIQNYSPSNEGFKKQAIDLIFKAEASVTMLSDIDPDLEYMGTTLTIALINKNKVFWAHVGDTRIYHLKGNTLKTITIDQTMAQFLVDEGDITQKEALNHPMQGLLEQSLGCGDCEPKAGSFNLSTNDILLLCSDGLYSEISSEQIKNILLSKKEVQEKIELLIKAANDAGGKDNISAIIAIYK